MLRNSSAYTPDDQLRLLIEENPNLLGVLSRFGCLSDSVIKGLRMLARMTVLILILFWLYVISCVEETIRPTLFLCRH